MAQDRRLKILWFEDEPNISMLYGEELGDGRLAEADVHLSTSLADAEAYLAGNTPDILFTDVNLHGQGDVAKFIRDVQKKNPVCEIAFVTAAQKSAVHTWPGTHFVEKTSDMDTLFGHLRQIHNSTKANLRQGATHQSPQITPEYVNELKNAHLGTEKIARSEAYKRLAGTGTRIGEGNREADIGIRYAETFLGRKGVNGRQTNKRKPWLSSKKPSSGIRRMKGIPR